MNNLEHLRLLSRDMVIEAENAMKKAPLFEGEIITEEDIGKRIELEVNHYFSEGVYARELFIPKGIALTGHIHKYSQLNIMLTGEMKVLIGDKIKHIKAPFMIVSPPGTKRIAYAIEDTIWITVHGTNETDIDKIEDHFIAKTEEEYLKFCNEQPKLPFEGIPCGTIDIAPKE